MKTENLDRMRALIEKHDKLQDLEGRVENINTELYDLGYSDLSDEVEDCGEKIRNAKNEILTEIERIK